MKLNQNEIYLLKKAVDEGTLPGQNPLPTTITPIQKVPAAPSVESTEEVAKTFVNQQAKSQGVSLSPSQQSQVAKQISETMGGKVTNENITHIFNGAIQTIQNTGLKPIAG